MNPFKRAFQAGFALFVYLACMPLALLPLRIGLRIGAMVGRIGFILWRSRRTVAMENIRLVQSKGYLRGYTPEDIAKRVFENLGRSLVEIIKVYYGFGDEIVKGVRFKGLENYFQVRTRGRPVIFITGHCGNWELLALATSYRLGRGYVTARRQNNPYINGMIERARTRYGNVVVYKKDALRTILKALKSGHPVGILMDQAVVRSEGLPVRFLGHEAWTLKSPVIIAKKTGAALLPAFIKRQDSGHLVTIYPEVRLSEDSSEESIKEDLCKLNTFFEDYITENPTEWLWIHRRWKKR